MTSGVFYEQIWRFKFRKTITCDLQRTSLTRKRTPLSAFLLPDQKVREMKGKIRGHPQNIRIPFCCFPPKFPDLAGFFGPVASCGTEIEESVHRAGGHLPARPMHGANRLAKPRPMVPHMPRRPSRPPRGGRHGKSPPRATLCKILRKK